VRPDDPTELSLTTHFVDARIGMKYRNSSEETAMRARTIAALAVGAITGYRGSKQEEGADAATAEPPSAAERQPLSSFQDSAC
jgi:hypothetical protein